MGQICNKFTILVLTSVIVNENFQSWGKLSDARLNVESIMLTFIGLWNLIDKSKH